VTAATPIVLLSTPGRAAYCETAVERSRLTCWRPADGLTMSMSGVGRAKPVIDPHNRGRHAPTGTVLRFTSKIGIQAIASCTSDRTGLTCRNSDKHGWWIGRREGFRIF
jgi:hypothetical protein